jgi:hypothetical protein
MACSGSKAVREKACLNAICHEIGIADLDAPLLLDGA